MTTAFSLSLLLLVFSLGSALGQEKTARSNASPVGKRAENDVHPLPGEHENGRPLNVVRDEIDFHTRAFNKHINDNNCAGLIKLYEPDFMLINQDGDMTRGLGAIQEILGAVEGVASMNMTSLSVTPLGRNARFIFQHAYAEARAANGNLLYTGQGFLIWKRHGHKLRIAMEIYDEGAATMYGMP